MPPGSVVYHLGNLSEGGGQGKRDPSPSLYLSVKVKSYWKNNEKEKEKWKSAARGKDEQVKLNVHPGLRLNVTQ